MIDEVSSEIYPATQSSVLWGAFEMQAQQFEPGASTPLNTVAVMAV
jgi:hypothetical protein